MRSTGITARQCGAKEASCSPGRLSHEASSRNSLLPPRGVFRKFGHNRPAPFYVLPIRFSMISASTRKTMDGMLTASQGGQVLISPRFENRPFRM